MKQGLTPRAPKFLLTFLAIAAISSNAAFAGLMIPISPRDGGDDIMPIGPISGGGGGDTTLANIEWANVGTDWATGSNWVGGTAPANSTTTDIAQFGSQNSSAVNPNVGAQRSVAGVAFLAGAFSYTVTGSSALIIGTGGVVDSATNTETFSNPLRTSASQTWTSNSGASLVLNGTVDLNQNAATTRTLTLNGAGDFSFNAAIQNTAVGSTGKIVYSGTGTLTLAAANTFNGGTTINSGTVIANHDGAFGTGSVSLTAGSISLTLQNGATNNYINDAATLSYVSGDSINLNYAGTDTVAGLIVDGVAQAPGVYGAGGLNPDSVFIGTGSLTVVPEPTTVAMMFLGAGLLAGAQRFRRKLR